MRTAPRSGAGWTAHGAVVLGATEHPVERAHAVDLQSIELRQREILEGLGFEVSGSGDKLEALVPSWRSDVEGEACLIEEVLRIEGFDRVPETPLPHGACPARA